MSNSEVLSLLSSCETYIEIYKCGRKLVEDNKISIQQFNVCMLEGRKILDCF